MAAVTLFIMARLPVLFISNSHQLTLSDDESSPLLLFTGNPKSSYYFFWIQTKYRDELAKFLLNKGVYTTFRYWPLNKIELFSKYTDNKYKTCATCNK
jgi:aminotransferase